MDEEKVAAKLDALVRLTAMSLLGEKSGGEAIAVLARAGLENELIAELVGTTTATVRATRSRIRKKDTS
jgi:DNA-binding NarL/FixJ family response regulator